MVVRITTTPLREGVSGGDGRVVTAFFFWEFVRRGGAGKFEVFGEFVRQGGGGGRGLREECFEVVCQSEL